jgi:predicted GTPase
LSKVRRAIIMGAAGRDFHNFNMYFRDNPNYRVVAFTAAQIPYIENRVYPSELAGKLYNEGIPIHPESMLEELIERYDVDEVFFSYSDVSHEYVMHIASRVIAKGASFTLLGMKDTQLKSERPVIAVVATRTGSGKSTIARFIADIARKKGLRVGVVRHPMPYKDFRAVQHIKSIEELDRLTVEEEEEYLTYLEHGYTVYAGVDYEQVLMDVEADSDIIIWDGGNNDMPFFRADHTITVTDALRHGQELKYHPGEVNLRYADTVVISKADLVDTHTLNSIIVTCRSVNEKAEVFMVRFDISVDDEAIKGKSVVVVEDAPTVTHGEMGSSLGITAIRRFDCRIVDGRVYAKGTVREAYSRYPWLEYVIPSLGYSEDQLKDLEDTLNDADCDYIVLATGADIARRMRLNKPVVRLRISVDEHYSHGFREHVEDIIERLMIKRKNNNY